MKSFRDIMKAYRNSKKSSVTIYIILRGAILLCMILQLIRGDINNAFLCLLSLLMFMLPIILKSRFKIELPNLLEIIIFLFIFSAEILGEIYNFYGNIPHWDTALHTINGFLCAGIGFALIDLLNENSKNIKLSPQYVAIVAFCFSMTVGVCWEFFEYGTDKFIHTDMQKDVIVGQISTVTLDPQKNNRAVMLKDIGKTVIYDVNGNELATINRGYLDIGLNDTMKDLLVNFTGALIFSVLGYYYTENKEKYKFTRHFIPSRSHK